MQSDSNRRTSDDGVLLTKTKKKAKATNFTNNKLESANMESPILAPTKTTTTTPKRSPKKNTNRKFRVLDGQVLHVSELKEKTKKEDSTDSSGKPRRLKKQIGDDRVKPTVDEKKKPGNSKSRHRAHLDTSNDIDEPKQRRELKGRKEKDERDEIICQIQLKASRRKNKRAAFKIPKNMDVMMIEGGLTDLERQEFSNQCFNPRKNASKRHGRKYGDMPDFFTPSVSYCPTRDAQGAEMARKMIRNGLIGAHYVGGKKGETPLEGLLPEKLYIMAHGDANLQRFSLGNKTWTPSELAQQLVEDGLSTEIRQIELIVCNAGLTVSNECTEALYRLQSGLEKAKKSGKSKKIRKAHFDLMEGYIEHCTAENKKSEMRARLENCKLDPDNKSLETLFYRGINDFSASFEDFAEGFVLPNAASFTNEMKELGFHKIRVRGYKANVQMRMEIGQKHMWIRTGPESYEIVGNKIVSHSGVEPCIPGGENSNYIVDWL